MAEVYLESLNEDQLLPATRARVWCGAGGLGAVEPTAVNTKKSEASKKAVAAMRDVFMDESLNVTDVVYAAGPGKGTMRNANNPARIVNIFAAAELKRDCVIM